MARRKIHIAHHRTDLFIFCAFILLIFLTCLHVFCFPRGLPFLLAIPSHPLVDCAFTFFIKPFSIFRLASSFGWINFDSCAGKACKNYKSSRGIRRRFIFPLEKWRTLDIFLKPPIHHLFELRCHKRSWKSIIFSYNSCQNKSEFFRHTLFIFDNYNNQY